MSGNATCSPADLAGAIEVYAHGLYSSYVLLILAVVYGSMLVPVLFALLYFSSARQKRTPLFVCVVLTVIFSLVQCIIHTVYQVKGLLHPIEAYSFVTTSVLHAIMLLDEMPNFLADIALLLRMLAVYPYSSTPRLTFIALFALPICLKAVRIAAVGEVMYWAGEESLASGTSLKLASQSQAWVVVSRVLDAVDNIYASAFFIWKLRSAFTSNHNRGLVHTGPFRHVRTLCWFALSSFILPVSLLLAEVVMSASSLTAETAFTGLQLSLGFSSAVCIAFATVWASTAQDTEPETVVTSPLRFATQHASKGFSSGSSYTETNSRGDASPLELKSLSSPSIRVRVDMEKESEV